MHLELLFALLLELDLLLLLEVDFDLEFALAFANFITTHYYYGYNYFLNVYYLNMRMEIFGPLFLSLLAGLSTMIGTLFIYIKFRNKDKFIIFSLSFSFTIMILISIFDLIPQSLTYLLNYYKFNGIVFFIVCFIIGYYIVIILNKMIRNNDTLYRIGILSTISLMLHNIPEGITVFMSSYVNIKLCLKLFLAILMHNIPEGISIAIPIYYSSNSRRKALIFTLISGISEPLGALISFLFLKNYINHLFISLILSFVSGLMISLSMNDIYQEIRYDDYKYIGYLSGVVGFIILNLII